MPFEKVANFRLVNYPAQSVVIIFFSLDSARKNGAMNSKSLCLPADALDIKLARLPEAPPILLGNEALQCKFISLLLKLIGWNLFKVVQEQISFAFGDVVNHVADFVK